MIEVLNSFWINDDLLDGDINLLKKYIHENKIKNLIILSKKSNYLLIKNINEINYTIEFNKNIDINILNNELYKKIFEITFIIHEYIQKNQKVLLIGHNNLQDVNTIVCAYYIRYGKVTLTKAIEYLKTKKKRVFEDGIFYYDTLNIFYNELNEL